MSRVYQTVSPVPSTVSTYLGSSSFRGLCAENGYCDQTSGEGTPFLLNSRTHCSRLLSLQSPSKSSSVPSLWYISFKRLSGCKSKPYEWRYRGCCMRPRGVLIWALLSMSTRISWSSQWNLVQLITPTECQFSTRILPWSKTSVAFADRVRRWAKGTATGRKTQVISQRTKSSLFPI